MTRTKILDAARQAINVDRDDVGYEMDNDMILAIAAEEGRKDDRDKPRIDLMPPEMIFAVSDVLTFGAKKYGGRNWESGMAWGRIYAALMRHLWAWWSGATGDDETGMSHLHHAGCCIAFLIAYEARGVGTDDRPGSTPANREQSDECPECGRATPCTASGCPHPRAMRGRVE